ncbi:molybdenum cofactor guanylyltransferase [Marinicrinis sediminis]|uniref:Molybdenum cofactor guanylyltransferase n=1 Tax=Marinicrinis sediminis TaxID=1652465 RepID=A0ABW5R5T7_9BACL
MSEFAATVILTAGGQSRRMGTCKAFLPFQGVPLIEHQLQTCLSVATQVVIVASSRHFAAVQDIIGRQEPIHHSCSHVPAVSAVTDHPSFSGEGPLAGLFTGLFHIHYRTNQIPFPGVFFLGCDLPFIDTDFLHHFHNYVRQDQADGGEYDAYIPFWNGQPQPLSSWLTLSSSTLLPYLQRGIRSWKNLIPLLRVHCIAEKVWRTWSRWPQPFLNLNTPRDYANALRMNQMQRDRPPESERRIHHASPQNDDR